MEPTARVELEAFWRRLSRLPKSEERSDEGSLRKQLF